MPDGKDILETGKLEDETLYIRMSKGKFESLRKLLRYLTIDSDKYSVENADNVTILIVIVKLYLTG
jgi:hypothetical protein